MADDSEMDYLRTFLGYIHTTATVKHYTELRNLNAIQDTSRMLIYPPEMTGATPFYTEKLFKVTLVEATEALMMAAINNIIIGCWKLNTRQAITSYTRPATFIQCKVVSSNQAYENGQTKYWFQDIKLKCKFTTS